MSHLYSSDFLSRQIEGFSIVLKNLSDALEPYENIINLNGLLQLKQIFSERTDEFFREDHKFNLAIIGQVKSGKSSFLNTLLFNGESVLPRAATPKTSVLTRIEYAERNQLEIEYLTPTEWRQLQRLAASKLHTPQVQAARETVTLAAERGTPIQSCLETKNETLFFHDYDELSLRLEEYVGDQGLFTPVVKYVTLRLSLDCLKNLSVVDTPGLNDPLRSRTQQTKKFIEHCDSAFFLSRSSYFLDENDIALLTMYLPNKGLSSLTLFASQYDSVLMDTIGDFSSLSEADLHTRLGLRRRAGRAIDAAIQKLRPTGTMTDLIEGCRRPVFVSAIAEQISQKDVGTYSPLEQKVVDELSAYNRLSPEEWGELGNFKEARKIFEELTQKKERLLEQKASRFVMHAKNDLRIQLNQALQDIALRRDALLKRRTELIQRQDHSIIAINHLRATLGEAIGQYLAPLDELSASAHFKINELTGEWRDLPSHTELKVYSRSKNVSAFELYRPSTWFSEKKVYFSEEVTRCIMDPDEVRAHIMDFWNIATEICTSAFLPMSDTSTLTNALYRIIPNELPHNSLMQQPEKLSKTVEQSLAILRAVPPPIAPDIKDLLPASFSQPTADPIGQQLLSQATANSVDQLSDRLRRYLSQSVSDWRAQGQMALERLCQYFGEDFLLERQSLIDRAAQTASTLNKLQDLAEILERYL